MIRIRAIGHHLKMVASPSPRSATEAGVGSSERETGSAQHLALASPRNYRGAPLTAPCHAPHLQRAPVMGQGELSMEMNWRNWTISGVIFVALILLAAYYGGMLSGNTVTGSPAATQSSD